MSRIGRVERTTKETSVLVEVDLDGTGMVDVSTGVGFFDHMLDQLGKHGLFDLTVKTEGDLHIDSHHTIEDTALALGAAFRQALGDKVGIWRFGNCTVPLDESLAQVTVDLSGRPYLVHTEPEDMAPMIGTYDTTMTRHILESFVAQAQIACTSTSPTGATPTTSWRPVQGTGPGAAGRRERDPRAVGRCPPPRAPCNAMNGLAIVLILVGLFLVGGVFSFVKQKMPKGLDRAAGHRLRDVLVAGILRIRGSGNERAAKKVVVLDYGSGNLRSAERALARVGAEVEITGDFDAALDADGLVVPGVGAFAACMEGLRGSAATGSSTGGWPAAGRCWASASACRSCSTGASSTASRPRAWASGPARSSGSGPRSCRTWAGTPSRRPADSGLFAGLDAEERFYFVHSYAVHDWELGHQPGDPRAAGHLGRARRAVRRRRGERRAEGHPVPPREVRRRRGPAAGQLDRDPVDHAAHA